MVLLPREKLIQTGEVDLADWVYRPILGSISRLRFKMALQLLGVRSQRLLEVGYGSGIFLPQLKRKCDELHGIDVHSLNDQVEDNLASVGTRAKLQTAPAERIPYTDEFFDAIVAVSSLEFLSDLDLACKEIRRVLKPGGRFVFVTPGQSRLLDAGLKLLTGRSAKEDFGKRRARIFPVIQSYFNVEIKIAGPSLLAPLLPLYYAACCTK